MTPLYEIAVDDDEQPTLLSAEALIEAWGPNVPDLAARVFDLPVGSSTIVFRNPEVLVRRIR